MEQPTAPVAQQAPEWAPKASTGALPWGQPCPLGRGASTERETGARTGGELEALGWRGWAGRGPAVGRERGQGSRPGNAGRRPCTGPGCLPPAPAKGRGARERPVPVRLPPPPAAASPGPALPRAAVPLAARGRRPAARGKTATGPAGSARGRAAPPRGRGWRAPGAMSAGGPASSPLTGAQRRQQPWGDRHLAPAEPKTPVADDRVASEPGGCWLEVARETEN